MTEWFNFSAAEWNAISLSLKVAFWAMLGSLPFGILISFILARGKFWGKWVLSIGSKMKFIYAIVES